MYWQLTEAMYLPLACPAIDSLVMQLQSRSNRRVISTSGQQQSTSWKADHAAGSVMQAVLIVDAFMSQATCEFAF